MTPAESGDLLLELAALDLLRTDAGADVRDLGERHHRREAVRGRRRCSATGSSRHVGGRGAQRVGEDDDHVVREALRILPRAWRAGRLNSGWSVAATEPTPRPARQASWRSTRTSSCGMSPSSLELGSATPGTVAHGLERAVGDDLEPRRLRALHVDLDRLAASRRRWSAGPGSCGRTPGICAQLAAQIVLDVGQRALVAGLERDEDLSLVRRAAEAAADREVGEIGLRLLLEEVGDLAAAARAVYSSASRAASGSSR